MLIHLRPALSLFVFFTILTGLVYPFTVTGLSQLVFPAAANGSLIESDGGTIGSELIGQSFTSAKYFWSRPSATGAYPYNGAASSGANWGPSAPALRDAVKQRIETLRAADPANTMAIPIDLVTASASGLDPHISLAAANYQLARVAGARGLPKADITNMIGANTKRPLLGFFGEPRVHVLRLNLALDERR